jgi:ferredoxin
LETLVVACSCNQTVSNVGQKQGELGKNQRLTHQDGALCRRGLSNFLEITRAAEQVGQPVLVTCTLEEPLFRKAAPATSEIRFVNIREHAGWGQEAGIAGAKIAALIAAAASAITPELPSVSYNSRGKTLIVADQNFPVARLWAEQLAASAGLDISFLWLGSATLGMAVGDSAAQRQFVSLSGSGLGLTGWLGNFQATWKQANPIDWDACVGCGACVSACPESAISSIFQVDLEKCSGHRSCVTACDTLGAIDFSRTNAQRSATFDTVFDLRDLSAFMRDAPQGYFWASSDSQRQTAQALELVQSLGEFEKPKYFDYKAKSCAHSRNQQTACTKCIDACSTGAISSAGDQVKVEPHLCMGCGACATVCPTGAMRYAAPDSMEMGKRLRTLLSTYAAANGKDAAVLFYDRRHGRVAFEVQSLSAPKGFKGIPARVLPFEVEHVGSVGLELMLAAKAYGASQVLLSAGAGFDAGYRRALSQQVSFANEIVNGLGLTGLHFGVLDAASSDGFESAVWKLVPAQRVAVAGAFELSKDKREALAFSIDHLLAQTLQIASSQDNEPVAPIALSVGAPFGNLEVNAAACTLCMACTGVCPKSALLDGQDKPQLRFIEANCVQCGLCVQTCPEKAITLVPRLNLDASAKQPRVVNEAEPMSCTSCGKAFGTKQMVESMLSKLSGHSMFAGDGLKRLKMCADCRVVDLIQNPSDGTIHDYLPQSTGAVAALTRNKGPNQ